MTVGPAVCSEYGSCDSCRLQPSLPDNDIIKTLPALGSRMYPGYFRLPVTDNCICNNQLMFSTFGYKKKDACQCHDGQQHAPILQCLHCTCIEVTRDYQCLYSWCCYNNTSQLFVKLLIHIIIIPFSSQIGTNDIGRTSSSLPQWLSSSYRALTHNPELIAHL